MSYFNMSFKKLAIAVFTLLISSISNSAVIHYSDLDFNIRYDSNDGSYIYDDNSGYLGGVIEALGNWTTKSFYDFDLRTASSALSVQFSVTLFEIDPGESISFSEYSADGIIDVPADFNASTNYIGSFAENGLAEFDITEIYNAAIGGYLGIVLEMETPGLYAQATTSENFRTSPGQAALSIVAIPIPSSMIMYFASFLPLMLLRFSHWHCNIAG